MSDVVVQLTTESGGTFETATLSVPGIGEPPAPVSMTCFLRGPKTLREYFRTADVHLSRDFLVFDDERYSFKRFQLTNDYLRA